ncbi:MAG: DegV family protein [Chloroflexi bacterium]|nr:DegV family protein [Chloroflexota bacterium]
MHTIRIVTDSSAHITAQEQKELGIEIIPLRIRLGRKTYKDGVDLTPDAYFRKIDQVKTLPQLVDPQLQDFINTFHCLSQEADTILSIHASSAISAAYQLAHTAAASLRTGTKIIVIDSETMGRGLGMIVKQAALAAAAGESADEIARLVRGIIPYVYFSFFIDDLSYPERDGRIRKSQALLGTMFGIKPLIEIREGSLIVMEKVRSQVDVVDKLYNFISEFAYLNEIALLQNNNALNATALLEQIETNYPALPVFTDTYSPSLATFIGPSALGVFVREDHQAW